MTRATGYCDTYYARTLQVEQEFPRLSGPQDADICIIGGGIVGVSAAWELTQRGFSVVLLEAQKIGWGASGRNGGILSAGFAASLERIEKHAGRENARKLFDLSREGVNIIVENTNNLTLPGVDLIPGVISVSRHPDAAGMKSDQTKMARDYDHDLRFMDIEETRSQVRSDRYFEALYDFSAYHFHPLNYCVGLARAAESAGAQVFEQSAMLSYSTKGDGISVKCENGTVKSKTIILCGGGYSRAPFGRLAHNIVPISTFVASTPPLGPLQQEIIATEAAVSDTRLSCDYFRVTKDGCLLWGGGMAGGRREPSDLPTRIKTDIEEVFPTLRDTPIDVAWSGVMAYARHKMPYLLEMSPGVWTATALGGHGMNTGPMLGRLLAEALNGDSDRADLFSPFKLCWNGGPAGTITANLICAASNFADRRREAKA